MKVIILNGSPRVKGNTKCITEKLTEGLLSAGHDPQTIDLYKKQLKACIACDGCRRQQSGRCIVNDQSGEVLQQLIAADFIVFAGPVYFWGVTAQMKIILDKFYSCEEELRGKRIGTVFVGEDGPESPQYRMINEQFSCIAKFLDWTVEFSESISAGKPGEIAENTEFMEKLFNIGKWLVH